MYRAIVLILSLALFLLLLPWGGLPKFSEVKASYATSNGSRSFFDREGELVHVETKGRRDRRQGWTTLEKTPEVMKTTLIRIEDQRFYEHHGIDFFALASMGYRALQGERVRGASTITMQLSSLLQEEDRGGSRNIFQKMRQMIAALCLDFLWTKSEILEAYINLVTYRKDLVGLEAASLGLFQKYPHGLGDLESLLLSSLLSSPNTKAERVAAKACQFTNEENCTRLKELSALALSGKSSALPSSSQTSVAPHFARLFSQNKSTHIKTTLNKSLQIKAEEIIKSQLHHLRDQNVGDAAVIVIDTKSREVLAYVGSSGELSKAREVDGVRALRQAGSTLKPFLYAMAMDQNLLGPDTLLDDSPFQIQTSIGIYSPQNYDLSFKGPVPARVALASSLNIPAVRVIELLGIDPFYDLLKRLGFSLKSSQNYGHSLALGALDVSLLQLAEAYASLANGGERKPLVFERDAARSTPSQKIFEPRTAKAITEILSREEDRSLTFGLQNELASSYPSAVKTGTSKDMRDNWCVGYSSSYLVAVWVGNFDGRSMWNVSGIAGAAPIWRGIMDHLHLTAQETRSIAREPESVGPTPLNEEPPVRSRSVHGPAKILYPTEGTLIAFDPDIPEENQAIVFEQTLGTKGIWQLNKTLLEKDYVPLKDLGRGQYRLALLDKDHRVLDEVHFELRR